MANENSMTTPQQPAVPAPQVSEVAPTVVQAESSGSFNKLWIIIGIIIILLVVVAGAVYFVGMQSNTAKDNGKREVKTQIVQSFGQLDKTLKEIEEELGNVDEAFADVDADLEDL